MSFDEFWAEYPKKVGKKQSRVEYDKVIKAGVTAERIMAGLGGYQRRKEDWRPWRDPERFLKLYLFDDYIDEKTPNEEMRFDEQRRAFREKYTKDPEYWGKFTSMLKLYEIGPYEKERCNDTG